jgi:hypothetical protein
VVRDQISSRYVDRAWCCHTSRSRPAAGIARRRYSLIVGLEFGLLGAGAAVLGATGLYRWIAVWICFGVGVHFFPLASTLANRSLRLLGVLLVAVAVAAAALTAGLGSATAPSTVTGAGTGFCLLAFGLATLLIGGRAPPRQTSLFRAKGVSMYG